MNYITIAQYAEKHGLTDMGVRLRIQRRGLKTKKEQGKVTMIEDAPYTYNKPGKKTKG